MTMPRVIVQAHFGTEESMSVSAKLLASINQEAQHVPINEQRWPELAIELNQLRAAAALAQQEHKFDRDPAEFLALLRSHRP